MDQKSEVLRRLMELNEQAKGNPNVEVATLLSEDEADAGFFENALDTAEEVGKGVYRGAAKGAMNIMRDIALVSDWYANKMADIAPYIPGVGEREDLRPSETDAFDRPTLAKDSTADEQFAEFIGAEETNTTVGGISQGVSQFLTGYALTGGVGGAPAKAGVNLFKATAKNAAKGAVHGTATDILAFDEDEANIIDVLNQHFPESTPEFLDILASSEDDSILEARLKNSLAGAVPGLFIDSLTGLLRGFKYRGSADGAVDLAEDELDKTLRKDQGENSPLYKEYLRAHGEEVKARWRANEPGISEEARESILNKAKAEVDKAKKALEDDGWSFRENGRLVPRVVKAKRKGKNAEEAGKTKVEKAKRKVKNAKEARETRDIARAFDEAEKGNFKEFINLAQKRIEETEAELNEKYGKGAKFYLKKARAQLKALQKAADEGNTDRALFEMTKLNEAYDNVRGLKKVPGYWDELKTRVDRVQRGVYDIEETFEGLPHNANTWEDPRTFQEALARTVDAIKPLHDDGFNNPQTEKMVAEMAEEFKSSPLQLKTRLKSMFENSQQAAAMVHALRSEAASAAKAIKKATTEEEAERAMQRFTYVEFLREEIVRGTARALKANQFKVKDEGEIFSRILRKLSKDGYEGNFSDLIRMAKNIADNPKELRKFLDGAQRPRYKRIIGELYYNGLLSSVSTQLVNAASNVFHTGVRPAEMFAGALLRTAALRKGATKDMAFAADLTTGLVREQGASLRAGAKSWFRYHNPFEGGSKVTEDDFVMHRGLHWNLKPDDNLIIKGTKAVANVAGNTITIPTRTLQAMDVLTLTANSRAHLFAQGMADARAKGVRGYRAKARHAKAFMDEKTTPEAMRNSAEYREALAYARKTTFTTDLRESSPRAYNAQRTIHNLPLGIGRAFIPFIRTPWNITMNAWHRTPVLNMLSSEVRANLIGKNGSRAQSEQIGQMLTSSAVAYMFFQLHQMGLITGSGPSDYRLRNQWRGPKGQTFQPNSTLWGDTWVQHNRLEPLGLLLGFYADLFDQLERADEVTQNELVSMAHLLAVPKALGSSLVSVSWLEGIGNMYDALVAFDKRAIERAVGQMAWNFAPYANQLRRLNDDPYYREARGVLDRIRNNVPGWMEDTPAGDLTFGFGSSKDLPRKYDALGRPIHRFPWDIARFTPMKIAKNDPDPATEIMKGTLASFPPVQTQLRVGKKSNISLLDFRDAEGNTAYDQLNYNIEQQNLEDQIVNMVKTGEIPPPGQGRSIEKWRGWENTYDGVTETKIKDKLTNARSKAREVLKNAQAGAFVNEDGVTLAQAIQMEAAIQEAAGEVANIEDSPLMQAIK